MAAGVGRAKIAKSKLNAGDGFQEPALDDNPLEEALSE